MNITFVHLIGFLLIFTNTLVQAEQRLTLPDGFHIKALPFEVPNARQMALTPSGHLIVGTRRAGKVYAVKAPFSENPEVITLFKRLAMPSGVAVHDGDLYIGATSDILKVANIDANLKPKPAKITLTDQLPDKRHHGWKYLKFGPDGQLYFPVGAPCNICLSEDERFASLLRMNPNTAGMQVWAHGIRNTVGFDWHPQTQALWFTDNGRDLLGDDVPPEEFNVISRPGEHFGYPFVHGNDIKDPEFGDHPARGQQPFTPPALTIQAHSAALGLTFYDAKGFPAAYQNALFVAEHGSWNRSKKVGYQVSVVMADEDGRLRHQPFVHGWLVGEKNWGRPNDVLVAPDGSLLVSDDQQGIIYQVTYQDTLLAEGGAQ